MKKQMKKISLAAAVLASGLLSAQALVPVVDWTQWGTINSHNAATALIYNGGGNWQVVYNPAESPYDGVEDTFVGILNLSSESIDKVTLSSPNVSNGGIFAFEGDGQQLYTGVNNGPTGYEGPGTSFANINANQTSGDVVFAAPLAPNGKIWFTLEDNITAASGGITVTNNPVPTTAPDAASTMALLTGAMGALGLVRRSLKK